MKNKSTLYVLGAGSSIGASRVPLKAEFDDMRFMPSAENFFYDIFKVKPNASGLDFLNFIAVMHPGLHGFLIQSWGFKKKEEYDPERWKSVNIEEVFTYFDVGSKMSKKGTKEKLNYERAKKELIRFLGVALTVRCNGQHCKYLEKIFQGLKKGDSIFSYNWDTIADHTLSKINSPVLRQYRNLLYDQNQDITKYQKKGVFLKLHGSLNWRICQRKQCSAYNSLIPPFKSPNSRLLTIEETYNCPFCGNYSIEPIIVPPVSDKLIHKNYILHKQWMLARQKLLFIDKIVFIGYSFPPTDFYSEWLFRQLNYIKGKPLPQIIVVNPEYSIENSLVRQRYSKIFRGYKTKWYSTLKDFTETV